MAHPLVDLYVLDQALGRLEKRIREHPGSLAEIRSEREKLEAEEEARRAGIEELGKAIRRLEQDGDVQRGKIRRKKSQMRGGLHQRQNLDDSQMTVAGPQEDLVELDEALKKLAEHNPVVAEVVTLRYFGGLTLEKIAEIKGITGRTARRYWQYARLWLFREMSG